LIGSLGHKTPKNVAASVNVLKEILHQFGLCGFAIKPILKCLPKLFDHRDKNVRQEAQNLTVELYRWVGSALMGSLNELKPVQLKDLNSVFEQITSEKPTPLRSRRGYETNPTSHEDENGEKDAEEEVIVPDVYDLADPVSFIEKIPKSFYSDVLSSKWKERKECLEQILPLVSHPKLEDGKYFELINILAKVQFDSLSDFKILILLFCHWRLKLLKKWDRD
jgi:cytoskeleton-associated protein 5